MYISQLKIKLARHTPFKNTFWRNLNEEIASRRRSCNFERKRGAAPTLYGKLNVSINQVDNKNFDGKSDVTEVNSNSSRIGVKGEEKLTDKLSAVYLAEWAISTDGSGSDTDLSARNRFIGLKLKASVR